MGSVLLLSDPILERLNPEARIIPNDASFSSKRPLQLLQGANGSGSLCMSCHRRSLTLVICAGKSTYLQQVALITVLAHAGSYVPATRATVGLMDRLMTRVRQCCTYSLSCVPSISHAVTARYK